MSPPRSIRADELEAEPPASVEAMPWQAFAEFYYHHHRPGEHVSIVGPTGSGKSVLGVCLAQIDGAHKAANKRPAAVTIFETKPRDRTMSALKWPIVRGPKEWPPGYGKEHVIVWPKVSDPRGAAQKKRALIEPIMREIYLEGGQTVYIDEAAYFEEPLPDGMGLRSLMSEYWTSARSLDLSLIAATQRPRRVSRAMWSEPAWVFIFRLRDLDDLKRVGEIAGNRDELEQAHAHLGGHEFLVIYSPRGGERRIFASRVGV